ncbi:MAG: hypothetical protein NTV51_27110 [Verrucomicrobia bacterium]|nr:hypothetical protein [Verrucomicrobiota bacterium]
MALVLLATGCATAWGPAEKGKLSKVAVAPTAVASGAYHKPDGTNSPEMWRTLPLLTPEGLVVASVGYAADAVVTTKQQAKFEETQLRYFEAVKKAMATAPATEVTAALKRGLGAHDFFGSRMAEKSATRFSAEIVSYGLQKAWPTSPTNDHLRIRLIVKIVLTLPDGSSLFECQVTGLSAVEKNATDILTTPDFFPKGYAEAAGEVAEQLAHRL